jgi:hypothetical protein
MIRTIQQFFTGARSFSTARPVNITPRPIYFCFIKVQPKNTSSPKEIVWMTKEQVEKLASNNLEKRLREIYSKKSQPSK